MDIKSVYTKYSVVYLWIVTCTVNNVSVLTQEWKNYSLPSSQKFDINL